MHILWPTVRPAMAADRARKWIATASKPDSLHFNFCVGGGDESHLTRLTAKNKVIWSLKSPHPGVCHPATKMTRACVLADDDILILASDDFEPVSAGWDGSVRGAFKPDGPGCLLNDGYRPGTNIVPIPVITGRLLKKLNGIVYHPAYRHFFSDQELYDILIEMGEIVEQREGQALFKHLHHSFDGRRRDIHDANNQNGWSRDKKMYWERKRMTLDSKLKFPETFE